MNIKKYKACIIGSGPAGITAGIYLARSRIDTCIFGITLGQLSYTTYVENFPGFSQPIMGPKLMEEMKQQAINFGAEFKQENIEKIQKLENSFLLSSINGEYRCESIIVATGSEPKWLGLESESKFKGYGVSSCATCDGPFYRDKVVAVVGGGNTAVEEAIYLSNIAQKVFLIHRRDKLRADKIMQEKLFDKKNIELIWNSEVQEIFGSENPKGIESLLVYNKQTNETNNLKVDGLFVAIGYTPQSKIVEEFVTLDDFGYVKKINTSGIFVAGDIADSKYRQAITSAGEGCKAALDLINFLEFPKLNNKNDRKKLNDGMRIDKPRIYSKERKRSPTRERKFSYDRSKYDSRETRIKKFSNNSDDKKRQFFKQDRKNSSVFDRGKKFEAKPDYKRKFFKNTEATDSSQKPVKRNSQRSQNRAEFKPNLDRFKPKYEKDKFSFKKSNTKRSGFRSFKKTGQNYPPRSRNTTKRNSSIKRIDIIK